MTIKVDHYLTHSQIKDILAATYNENMELVLSLMYGVPINELQSFLGHSSIVITQLYLKTNQLNSESWNIE
jgi:integrase